MIIYKTTNNINGKYYIGKTIQQFNRRKRRHENDAKKGSEIHFHRALRKYGFDNFKWEILLEGDFKDDVFRKMEVDLITELSATNSNIGYNITSGGNGGDTLSNNPNIKEIGKKISEKRKGIKQTEEHIKKRINARILTVQKNKKELHGLQKTL